jgi:hypothetical protein
MEADPGFSIKVSLWVFMIDGLMLVPDNGEINGGLLVLGLYRCGGGNERGLCGW